MNKAVMIVGGLFPLVGAAAGGMVYLEVPPFAAPAAIEAQAATVTPAAVVAPPVFVDAGIVGVPIFKGNQVAKSIVLQLQLDVVPTEKLRVEADLPRLQHSFQTDLLAFIPRHLLDRNHIDLAVVKRRLVKVSERVVGFGAVRDVLVTGVQER